jgi:hypothetical protein
VLVFVILCYFFNCCFRIFPCAEKSVLSSRIFTSFNLELDVALPAEDNFEDGFLIMEPDVDYPDHPDHPSATGLEHDGALPADYVAEYADVSLPDDSENNPTCGADTYVDGDALEAGGEARDGDWIASEGEGDAPY